VDATILYWALPMTDQREGRREAKHELQVLGDEQERAEVDEETESVRRQEPVNIDDPQ
jgi:hypothetical protein